MGSSLLELHMLGTGTSGCIPTIAYITHPNPNGGCECCLSALTPEGKKNARRNTSAMLRVKPDGANTKPEDVKSILIDCGKSFLPSALEWFPQKGFRKIDALIITHAHSDAMNGLDDLRGWTLGGNIQEKMDIYVTAATYKEIERTYPYLINVKLSTGSGEVPAINYNIFDEYKPFECHGMKVTPLPVYHGVHLSPKQPFYSLGFLFNRSIAYISDVSYIPEPTWKILLGDVPRKTGNCNDVNEPVASSGPDGDALQGPPVLVLDCGGVYLHKSHFGFAQSAATARRLKAKRTYILGFAHRILHTTWESICTAVESGERPQNPPRTESGGLQVHHEDLLFGRYTPPQRLSEVPAELKEIALEVLEEWEGGPKDPLWLRPTFDGHMIAVDEAEGTSWDSEYAKEAETAFK